MFPVFVMGRNYGILAVKRIIIYVSALVLLHLPDGIIVGASVEHLLEKGTRLLASGQLGDALAVYIQAVDEDPKNHLTFYRRGTAYLAMGNVKLALPDFDKAVSLNSGYVPAIKQRANLYLTIGKLSEAKSDYNLLLSSDPEAHEKLNEVNLLERQMEETRYLYKSEQYHAALELLDVLIEAMNFNQEMREIRSNCYLRLGDTQRGVHEMRHAVYLQNDNRDGLLKLSQLMYESGMALQSLEEIRECLRLDQDDKKCLAHYRKIKKLAKSVSKAQETLEASSYRDCIKHAEDILKFEPSHPEYKSQAYSFLCQCHARSNSDQGITYCEEMTNQFPNNLDFRCDLADSYINADKFDEAIQVCQKIMDEDRHHQRARELHSKAQKLLKSSKRVDYYKVLGVSRSATKSEIGSAYRKLAKQWHPDKFEGDEKKKAEKEFRMLASAKEVLTDPELRSRYDSGEDPLDPEQQQQHHQGPFNPFGSFNGFPFGNGHFEFHFG